MGKNRAEVTARDRAVKAREAEQEQTQQLLASGVARLYSGVADAGGAENVLMQIEHEQQNVVTVQTGSCINTALFLQGSRPISTPAKPSSS